MLGFGRRRHNRVDTARLAALELTSTPVMVADMSLNIIYMNQAVLALLGEAESDMRQDFPGFAATALIGTNIDQFHRDPAHQRGLLEHMEATHKATIRIGHRTFDLVVNPLFDVDHNRLGTVVEWGDAAQRLTHLDYAGQIAAVNRAQLSIEFAMDGTIIGANPNFLRVSGYSLSEVVGKKHAIFAAAQDRESAAYRQFWERLRAGEHQAGEFRRVRQDGTEIWLHAAYNPILDEKGKPYKVVKFAIDITAQKVAANDFQCQISSIDRSQAVIEFTLDGMITTANDNFLRSLGYTLDEIKGRHHSIFVAPEDRTSTAYKQLWDSLKQGDYQAGQYRRISKFGKDVWIQGSYSPIFDLNGKPYKVVKFAVDVTASVQARLRSERVSGMLHTVAGGAENLNASVREIAQAMVKSKDIANEAFDRVNLADQTTLQLTDAAKSMGGIVNMIVNLTGQINLLALNATIESARAGEAGRGFAVVAAEVKNLANQARVATDQIASQIDSMRGIFTNVSGNLEAVKHSILQVRDYVTSTAVAVEEQSAVASEMSAGMQQAAHYSTEMA